MIDSAITNLTFVLFGLGSAWLGWRALQRARSSTAWPRTQGSIVASDVQREHNGEYETRRAVIVYSYEVAGTGYLSRRVGFGDGVALLWDRSREARLAAYQVGSSVAVAYDPGNPAEAVLEPGPNWAVYVSVIAPAALALFGLFNLVGGS